MKKFITLSNLLVLSLLLQFLGFFIITNISSSILESYLFLELDFDESLSKNIDYGLALFSFISILLALLTQNLRFCIVPGLHFLLISYLSFQYGTSFFDEAALLTQAPRYLTPILLFAWGIKSPRIQNMWFFRFLKLSLASVYIFHGVKALSLSPIFIDYTIILMEWLFFFPFSQKNAEFFLHTVGLLDMIAGLVIIFSNHTKALWYMVVWGFLTAFARLICLPGFLGLGEFLLRAQHWLLPIILIMYNNPLHKIKYKLQQGKYYEKKA